MNKLGKDFQNSLLRVIFQDHSFLPKYRDLVSSDLFSNELHGRAVGALLSYFDTYNGVPKKEILVDYTCGKPGIDVIDMEESIEYAYSGNISDVGYVKDKLREFVQHTRMKEAIEDSIELMKNGDFAGIVDRVKNTISNFDDEGDIGKDFWEEKRNILTSLDSVEPYIPTGFSELDSIMSGGAVRGTENVIVTPPNKGKSTTLVNIGKYAILNGYRVVHYTFELSEKIILRRYAMSMCGMSKSELKSKKRTAYNKMVEMSKDIQEKSLIVKHFPASTCKVSTMAKHISKIKDRYGFVPDLILVDYADLMVSNRHYEQKRFELSEIFKELRCVAEDFNVALWTATQTNSSGNREETITIDFLAECFEKAAIADVIVSLNQTLDEKRNNEARLFLAKNRDDPSLDTIQIRTDWARAFVGDY